MSAANVAALMRLVGTYGVLSGMPADVRVLLQLGARLIERGEQAAADLAALTELVRVAVSEGRGLTAEEREQLRARADLAHARLQELASAAPAIPSE